MDKRTILKAFGRQLKEEIIIEVASYRDIFPPLFDEAQVEWPSSYSKRYITLTGALRDSLSVVVTSDRVQMNWNTPYKNRIRYGWVTKSGSSRKGRDWVKLALKKHPIEGAIKRAIASAVNRQPHLRLISIR